MSWRVVQKEALEIWWTGREDHLKREGSLRQNARQINAQSNLRGIHSKSLNNAVLFVSPSLLFARQQQAHAAQRNFIRKMLKNNDLFSRLILRLCRSLKMYYSFWILLFRRWLCCFMANGACVNRPRAPVHVWPCMSVWRCVYACDLTDFSQDNFCLLTLHIQRTVLFC